MRALVFVVVCESSHELTTYGNATDFSDPDALIPFTTNSGPNYKGLRDLTVAVVREGEKFEMVFHDQDEDETLMEVTMFVRGSHQVEVEVEFSGGLQPTFSTVCCCRCYRISFCIR